MSNNAIIGIVIGLIIIISGIALLSNRTDIDESLTATTTTSQQTDSVTSNLEGNRDMDGATPDTEATTPVKTNVSATTTVDTTPVVANSVKTVTITSDNFKFSVNEIRVKKGQTVKIILNNEEGFHDWKIDEFKAATTRLQGKGTATVSFVASKTGTFEYYCSVGQHRQMGMRGNLIVE